MSSRAAARRSSTAAASRGGKGDIITLRSWALHEHANLSARDAAILFSIQDRPVLEALGLYREEGSADNDGHQAVTSSTFTA